MQWSYRCNCWCPTATKDIHKQIWQISGKGQTMQYSEKKIQVVHLRLHEPQHVKCIRTLTFALKDWTTMFVKFARRKLLLYKRNMEVWLSLKASFIWTNCKTSRGMFFGENNAKEPRLVKSSQTLHTNYQAQWGDLGLDCCHGTAAFCGT